MNKLCRKYLLYISFLSVSKNSFSDRLFPDIYDMLYFYVMAALYNITKHFKGKLFTSEICPFWAVTWMTEQERGKKHHPAHIFII